MLRAGGEEPGPELLRHSLREVIGHCIYGVDINPMAVELCKVGLWLEAVEPGKPLTFLDHHIKCGNSLLGATPAVIREGIPDRAYEPLTGDTKEAVRWMRKLNQEARSGQGHFDFAQAMPWERLGNLPTAMAVLETLADDTPEALARKEMRYREIVEGSGYESARLLHDTWCAAFVWPKDSVQYGTELTTEHLRKIERNPHSVAPHLKEQVRALARQYRFFHWHIEFPAVFGAEGDGGFDVVLGNPPWDMQEIKDNEFFAVEFPEMLSVKSAKEKAGLLERIRSQRPDLWEAYATYVRIVNGETHLITHSGKFPLSAVGRLNLYRLFVETGCMITSSTGRTGLIIPSGFASDTFAQAHFKSLFNVGQIMSLFDFENKEGLFPEVDSRYRFCLLTVLGHPNPNAKTHFVFFAHDVSDLHNGERQVWLSHDDIADINPLSGTPPQFRSPCDLYLTKHIHSRSVILCPESATDSWSIKPKLMFMMNASLTAHRTAEELEAAGGKLLGNRFEGSNGRWLPFYEGKMVGMFDHRAASILFNPSNRVRRNQPEPLTAEQHNDPHFAAIPMFWLPLSEVQNRCGGEPRWLVAVKDVTSATNERTVIGAILPQAALTDSVPWLADVAPAASAGCLLATLNSFAVDFIARQKVSGLHLRGHYLNQLPVLLPCRFDELCPWARRQTLRDWLLPRILELTYTAWDLKPFAHDCGYDGPPFRWDEERRFLLRCELDAAFFHLYLGPEDEWRRQPEDLIRAFPTPRDAVAYIMDTFPIVKRKDEAAHGEYRTKCVIMQSYDAMQHAIDTGTPYQTLLDPPPADPWVAHPGRGNDSSNVSAHVSSDQAEHAVSER
jgi:hypothetical protein